MTNAAKLSQGTQPVFASPLRSWTQGEHTVVNETETEPVLSPKKEPPGPGQSLADKSSSPDP